MILRSMHQRYILKKVIQSDLEISKLALSMLFEQIKNKSPNLIHQTKVSNLKENNEELNNYPHNLLTANIV